MRTWSKKFEWTGYANCLEDARFISETSSDDEELELICGECRVRPECAKWATDDEVSSVFVVGVRLPDPMYKRQLRAAHDRLRASIPLELEHRGEDV
jgi:hypothetical protein